MQNHVSTHCCNCKMYFLGLLQAFAMDNSLLAIFFGPFECCEIKKTKKQNGKIILKQLSPLEERRSSYARKWSWLKYLLLFLFSLWTSYFILVLFQYTDALNKHFCSTGNERFERCRNATYKAYLNSPQRFSKTFEKYVDDSNCSFVSFCGNEKQRYEFPYTIMDDGKSPWMASYGFVGSELFRFFKTSDFKNESLALYEMNVNDEFCVPLCKDSVSDEADFRKFCSEAETCEKDALLCMYTPPFCWKTSFIWEYIFYPIFSSVISFFIFKMCQIVLSCVLNNSTKNSKFYRWCCPVIWLMYAFVIFMMLLYLLFFILILVQNSEYPWYLQILDSLAPFFLSFVENFFMDFVYIYLRFTYCFCCCLKKRRSLAGLYLLHMRKRRKITPDTVPVNYGNTKNGVVTELDPDPVIRHQYVQHPLVNQRINQAMVQNGQFIAQQQQHQFVPHNQGPKGNGSNNGNQMIGGQTAQYRNVPLKNETTPSVPSMSSPNVPSLPSPNEIETPMTTPNVPSMEF